MSASFEVKLQRNEIRLPTQKGFSLDRWDKAWEQEPDKTGRNGQLYRGGVIIFSLLEEIRFELSSLHQNAPGLSVETLLKAYLALSNRDRAIAQRSFVNSAKKTENLFSATLDAAVSGNQLTLQEIADNCVDSKAKAVCLCKKRLEDKEAFNVSPTPCGIMEFVAKDAHLSEFYGALESYWRALLWGKCELEEIDKDNKVYAVTQKACLSEVSGTYSQIRKQRLAAQIGAMSINPEIRARFAYDKYIVRAKDGRRKTIKAKAILDASEAIVNLNSSWRIQEIFLRDHFPRELLEDDCGFGFTLTEALDVLRCLSLLARQFMDDYPDDDSARGIKKLIEFCPLVNKVELARGVERATGGSFRKAVRILDFIEFHGDRNEDLWSHPLIDLGGGEFALLTSALASPVANRVIEHWIAKLNMDMDKKGQAYEKAVINIVRRAASSNPTVSDFEGPIGQRIKIESGEEEIDFLMKVGDTVLLGEAKSIVTTDSPISEFRTREILKHASAQVTRKAEFVRSNIAELFDYLEWEFDESASYEILGCIINSGRMYVGSPVDGVPVCDEYVLESYFSSGVIPYLSGGPGQKGEIEHLAWFEVYDDFASLQRNLRRYLESPPHLENALEDFEYRDIALPYFSNDSYKIIYRRLVAKDRSTMDRINMHHGFPLKTVENIEQAVSDAWGAI